MSGSVDDRRELRETLKRLRAERAELVRAATEVSKRQRVVRAAIVAELRKGPATVPALASACGRPSREVMWHIAAMRKYGELVEAAQEGSYFTYRLVSPQGELRQKADD